MKQYFYIILFLTNLSALSQSNSNIIFDNWIITDNDLTRLNQVPNDWSLGNVCDTPNFIDAFINGDLILKDTCYIKNARLTVYGEVIGNFPILLECETSELIIENNTLSIVNESNSNPSLFPNPTRGVFHLNTNKPFKVIVYNIEGKKVSNTNNISNEPQGIYIVLVIFENNEKHILKVIKS